MKLLERLSIVVGWGTGLLFFGVANGYIPSLLLLVMALVFWPALMRKVLSRWL